MILLDTSTSLFTTYIQFSSSQLQVPPVLISLENYILSLILDSLSHIFLHIFSRNLSVGAEVRHCLEGKLKIERNDTYQLLCI